jgi:hypothetical protein
MVASQELSWWQTEDFAPQFALFLIIIITMEFSLVVQSSHRAWCARAADHNRPRPFFAAVTPERR